jgi:hypothetical protein
LASENRPASEWDGYFLMAWLFLDGMAASKWNVCQLAADAVIARSVAWDTRREVMCDGLDD